VPVSQAARVTRTAAVTASPADNHFFNWLLILNSLKKIFIKTPFPETPFPALITKK
jgi:hypothetical protein